MDEIDIEEHDVLDNPAIRNIFPDISVIKQEIENYYDDSDQLRPATNNKIQITSTNSQDPAVENTSRGNYYDSDQLQPPTNNEEIQITTSISTNSQDPAVENTSKITTSVKIESYDKIEDGVSSADSIETKNIVDLTDEPEHRKAFHSNRIILGTKPNKTLDFEEFFNKHTNVDNIQVLIDDLGPYLMSSKRFCKICLTLYPNEYSFNQHDLMHREDDMEPNNGRKCYKCSKSFSSIVAYNTHFSTLHKDSKDQWRCHLCCKSFSTQIGLQIHMTVKHNQLKEGWKCHACSKRFLSCTALKIHFAIKHKNVTAAMQHKEAKTTWKCQKCSKCFSTGFALKVHNGLKHKQLTFEKTKATNAMQHKEAKKTWKCQKCSKCFSTGFALKVHHGLKHKQLTFEKTKATNAMQHKEAKKTWKCQKCSKCFSTGFALKVHHGLKHKQLTFEKTNATNDSKRRSNYDKQQQQQFTVMSDKLYYKCHVCSYYFTDQEFCIAHLLNRHGVTEHTEALQKQPLNPNCQFCPKKKNTLEAYNCHICEYHKDKLTYNPELDKKNTHEQNQICPREETSREYGSSCLKSDNDEHAVYYKCHVCSIYFTLAVNCSKHMKKKHGIIKDVTAIRRTYVCEKFRAQCQYCEKKLWTVGSYRVHILTEHKELYSKKISQGNGESITPSLIQGTAVSCAANDNMISADDEEEEIFNDIQDRHNTQFYRCHLCSIYYRTAGACVSHIYRQHGSTTYLKDIQSEVFVPKCLYCPKQFSDNDIASYKHHIMKKHKSYIGIEKVKMKNPGHNISKTQYYVCSVCSCYFIDSGQCLKHQKIMHGIMENFFLKKSFDTQCEFCDTNSKSLERYNNHIREIHKVKYYSKPSMKLEMQLKKLNSSRDESLDHSDMDQKDHLLYKCHVCSTYFCSIVRCCIHLETKHGITMSRDVIREPYNPQCQHCNLRLRFNSHRAHMIKRHYNIYNMRVESQSMDYEKIPNELKNCENKPHQCKNFEDTSTDYYKCDVCSYYFITVVNYMKHMQRHGIMDRTIKDVKKEPFDATCKFCNKKVFDFAALNAHISKVHNERYNKKKHKQKEKVSSKSNAFIFKSVLFKCKKCDIHFLSAQNALNHTDHMELMINWKCSICQRIFKKNDEKLHKRQHNASDQFVVYELDASTLSRVLYNCPKCAIHFTEDLFLKHYPVCDIETPNATYCTICDILIDEDIIKSHKLIHIEEQSADFVLVQTDVINSIDETSESCGIKTMNIVEPSTTIAHKNQDLDDDFDLFYCEKCKCFLNKNGYNVHDNGECLKLEKKVCASCGIVLSLTCYSSHRKLHFSVKNLKLQDFTFRSLASKQQICPPIPEFPKCNDCEIIFISKYTLSNHECCEEEYLICHLCEEKISEVAFKLHMSYHNYSITNMLGGNISEDKYPKSKEKKTNSDVPEPEHSNKSVLFNSQSELAESDLSINQIFPISKTIVKQISIPKLTQSRYTSANTQKRDKSRSELSPIIYSCKNCGITVDTYEKVIEHCQSHFDQTENEINGELCHDCDLKFDTTCYERHKDLHREKTFFKLLNFDTFYFTSENHVWIKHVFGSLPQSLIDQIVNKSIYKVECRIKMQILQDGPAELTVYKCDKCDCYVDESVLYKHAENSCFKLRKHPCTVCGLPFISSLTRIQHEKIHEAPNISLKSYRIVVFNKEEHRTFNNSLCFRKLYSLHQCRNCDGITDKSQISSHNCAFNNLRKCLECGLLICNDEYETHVLRHKELPNFTQNNMVVILFGEKSNDVTINLKKLVASYDGIVYDHTYYKCNDCQICIKKADIATHVCSFSANKSQCPLCHLNFHASILKGHLKLHNDPDFVIENMRVLSFDAQIQKDIDNNSEPEEDISESDIYKERYSDSQDLNDSQNSIDTVSKVAKIYKCVCGLHFLDQTSISTHIQSCNPKIRRSKQKCSKCDLLFTPNILFSHLIKHHGDKKHKYIFEVIDMGCTYNIDLNNVLYKCSKCELHFVKGKDASEHLNNCDCKTIAGRQCNFCSLKFGNSCVEHHEQTHLEIDKINHKIFEIKDCSIPLQRIDQCIEMDTGSMNTSNTIALSSIIPKKVRNPDRTLYKCKKCGIHYINKSSLSVHFSNKHKIKSKFQDICNFCGLSFSTGTLQNHIIKHHRILNLKPNDLLIKEF